MYIRIELINAVAKTSQNQPFIQCLNIQEIVKRMFQTLEKDKNKLPVGYYLLFLSLLFLFFFLSYFPSVGSHSSALGKSVSEY